MNALPMLQGASDALLPNIMSDSGDQPRSAPQIVAHGICKEQRESRNAVRKGSPACLWSWRVRRPAAVQ